MTNSLPRILICDDDQTLQLALRFGLKTKFDVQSVYNTDEAIAVIKNRKFDVLLLDVQMRTPTEGIDSIPKIKEIDSDIHIVMLSGSKEFSVIRTAMKSGAVDYIPKDAGSDEIIHSINRVLERKFLLDRQAQQNYETVAQHRKHTLVGQSPAIQSLLKMIHRIRESNAHVLIYGETGTGKEVVARLLRSSLPSGVLCPFVAVDSATIHGQTAESVLFGHEKGAFTGADKLRKGVFEEANGGTVYFDEIANMSLDIQAKLLRVIQEKEVVRMGSARAIPLEFRVIAATNRDLDEMVKQRLFKDDLLQRLNVIPISLPSLRDRTEDIPALIDHFCSLHSRGLREMRFTDRALTELQRYRWPGNIRELGNLVAFLYATSESDEIDVYDLPPKFSEQSSVSGNHSSTEEPRLSLETESPFYERVAQFEKQVLSREYDKFKGNVSRMALALQMDRSHLHSKLRTLGIHSKDRTSAETFT